MTADHHLPKLPKRHNAAEAAAAIEIVKADPFQWFEHTRYETRTAARVRITQLRESKLFRANDIRSCVRKAGPDAYCVLVSHKGKPLPHGVLKNKWWIEQ